MFSIGKMSPESRKESRKPPSATACTAAAWLGMAAPTIEPKLITQNTNSALPAMMGVGSPANRRPKSVNISSASSEHCDPDHHAGQDLAEQKLVRRDAGDVH